MAIISIIENEDGEFTAGAWVSGSQTIGESATVETADENGKPLQVTGTLVDFFIEDKDQ